MKQAVDAFGVPVRSVRTVERRLKSKRILSRLHCGCLVDAVFVYVEDNSNPQFYFIVPDELQDVTSNVLALGSWRFLYYLLAVFWWDLNSARLPKHLKRDKSAPFPEKKSVKKGKLALYFFHLFNIIYFKEGPLLKNGLIEIFYNFFLRCLMWEYEINRENNMKLI